LNGKQTIMLNQNDNAGTMAITISHEYAHTHQTVPATASARANGEAQAWDASRPVYDNLQSPFRGQVSSFYINGFAVMTPGSKTRAQQINQWNHSFISQGYPP